MNIHLWRFQRRSSSFFYCIIMVLWAGVFCFDIPSAQAQFNDSSITAFGRTSSQRQVLLEQYEVLQNDLAMTQRELHKRQAIVETNFDELEQRHADDLRRLTIQLNSLRTTVQAVSDADFQTAIDNLESQIVNLNQTWQTEVQTFKEDATSQIAEIQADLQLKNDQTQDSSLGLLSKINDMERSIYAVWFVCLMLFVTLIGVMYLAYKEYMTIKKKRHQTDRLMLLNRQMQLGHACWQTFQYEKAIDAFEVALSMDPKNKQIHEYLSHLMITKSPSNPEGAKYHARQLINEDRDHVMAHLLLAEAMQKSQDNPSDILLVYDKIESLILKQTVDDATMIRIKIGAAKVQFMLWNKLEALNKYTEAKHYIDLCLKSEDANVVSQAQKAFKNWEKEYQQILMEESRA